MIFYFIVFIVNTVTCSVWRYICCLSLVIVKLIYLFIMFRFFATGYFILVKWRYGIWRMSIPVTVRLNSILAEPATLSAAHVYHAVSVSWAIDSSRCRPDISNRILSFGSIALPSLNHVTFGDGIPWTGQRSTTTLFLTTLTCWINSAPSTYTGTVHERAHHQEYSSWPGGGGSEPQPRPLSIRSDGWLQ